MDVRWPLSTALLVLLGASLCLADVCHLTDPIQRQECSSVSLMYGTSSAVRQGVLQQLCEAGHRHVLLKGASPSQYQSLAALSPRRAEQFAVLYIHRDDFSEKVNWKSGEAADIMCNDNWFVDDEVKLTNGYRWYTHGLPLWPMLNQTLAVKKQSILSRKKRIEWPTYAIATPFYLVPFEIYNSRDPGLAIQKRFAGDFAQGTITNTPPPFAGPNFFKDKVMDFYRLLFLDQAGYARKDINSDFEQYINWLQPLVQSSLGPMLESFLKSQTPKKGQSAICPDELYLFFHQRPCVTSTSCIMLNELQLTLKLSNCPDTKIVVGYGGSQGAVTEEIIATKVVGKAESAPSSQVAPAPEPPVGSSAGSPVGSAAGSPGAPIVNPAKGAAPCNKCHFQTVGGFLVLLTIWFTSWQ